MTTSSNRAALAFAAAVSFILFALPLSQASAMGRSGAPTVQPDDNQSAARLGQVESGQKSLEADLRSQMEALRRELKELRARFGGSDRIASVR